MLHLDKSQIDNTEIVRSPVSEGTILPFVIEIDTEESNLYPDVNENQRFCYSVTGLGTENDKYADLSCLILGIGDQIMQDEIADVSVVIKGIDQDMILDTDECVKITTEKNSDGMLEYPGLRFDIKLNKSYGEMYFSFELKRPYPIGRNRVYLIGSNAAVNELSTFGPVNRKDHEGYGNAYQDALVSIPVEVMPRAGAGEIKTSCCGEPAAEIHQDHNSGKCCITVIQPIRVEIPLEFGAEALIGDLFVNCGKETHSERKSFEPPEPSLPKYKTFY